MDNAYVTDASETGFGVVETPACGKEIDTEARYAEKRSWVVNIDAAFSQFETEAEDEVDPAVRHGAMPPQNIADITASARVILVILHALSGRRRHQDFEHQVDMHSLLDHYHVIAIPLDSQVDADTGDLAKSEVVTLWSTQIRIRRVRGLLARPLCTTWSAILSPPLMGGPRPGRSVEQPWGIDDLTPGEPMGSSATLLRGPHFKKHSDKVRAPELAPGWCQASR